MSKIKFRIPNVGYLFSAVILSKQPEIYLGNSGGVSVVCFNHQTKVLKHVMENIGTVFAMELSNDENRILVSGHSREMYVICTERKVRVCSIVNPENRIFGLQFLKDSNLFFSVSSTSVSLVDIEKSKVVVTLKGLRSTEKRCLCLSRNDTFLCGSSLQHNLGYFNLKRGHRFIFLKGHQRYFRCHTLNENESRLYSGTSGGSLVNNDLRSGKKLYVHNFNLSAVTCVRSTTKRIFVTVHNKHLFILEDSSKLIIIRKWEDDQCLFHFAVGRDLVLFGGMDKQRVNVLDLDYILSLEESNTDNQDQSYTEALTQ